MTSNKIQNLFEWVDFGIVAARKIIDLVIGATRVKILGGLTKLLFKNNL